MIEPDLVNTEPVLDAHSMDPVRVLGLARTLGSLPPRVLVLGCEPGTEMSLEDEELVMGLSTPVAAAIDEAVELAESLLEDLLTPASVNHRGAIHEQVRSSRRLRCSRVSASLAKSQAPEIQRYLKVKKM